jgi:hypothetical protein
MDNHLKCICDVFERINGFYSIYEFEKFQDYINGLIKDGELIEIPVKEKYFEFKEQWFQCTKYKHIWRLVYPDFPFKGLWKKFS